MGKGKGVRWLVYIHPSLDEKFLTELLEQDAYIQSLVGGKEMSEEEKEGD